LKSATLPLSERPRERRTHLLLAGLGAVTRGTPHREDMLSRHLVVGGKRERRAEDKGKHGNARASHGSHFQIASLPSGHVARPTHLMV
jgi:hypothetical protein